MSKFAGLVIICSAAAFAAPAVLTRLAPVAMDAVNETANCNIKGNISIETGEHIYHVPGQAYYAVTKISPHYGERWFCSEDQARSAGWRKARR